MKTTHSDPVFSTKDYEVVVLHAEDPELMPWRYRNFVVQHRKYKVAGAVTGVLGEAIVAAKLLQESTDVVLDNLDKSVGELAALDKVAAKSLPPTFN